MRFGSNVIMFEAFSVPMVGNAATSYLIGLTPEGAEVCRRMLAEDVSEEEVAAVDAHLPEHLQRGGFLESRERSCSLQSAYLHVTQACNLDCVGCYSCDEQRNRSEDLPLEALCAIVDELGRRGVSRLVISGGEPFLRDDLAALVRHAKEQAGIGSIDVLTNGTCISAEKLAALAPYVDRVSVSFDGASADAPSPIRGEQRFDQLVAAVEAIRQAGIAAHIIPTIHKGNVADIAAYSALAAELGATMNFSLLSAPDDGGPLSELLPDDAALAELAERMLGTKEHPPVQVADVPVGAGLRLSLGCGAGCSGVSVGHDGRVYPCHMLHDDALVLGSLAAPASRGASAAEGGAPAAALEAPDFSVLSQITVDEVEACCGCEIKYLCGGGCRARAYFATGDLRGLDPYCALMREYYRLLFQRMMGR